VACFGKSFGSRTLVTLPNFGDGLFEVWDINWRVGWSRINRFQLFGQVEYLRLQIDQLPIQIIDINVVVIFHLLHLRFLPK
jgi:hypothetical protein